MSDEEKLEVYRSGTTGEFDIDELGLSDEEIEAIRQKKKQKIISQDGWEDWGDPWEQPYEKRHIWAEDERWFLDEKKKARDLKPQKRKGTASFNLNDLPKEELHVDEEWQYWDQGKIDWGTSGTASFDIRDLQEEGLKDLDHHASVYGRDLDDSNYRAGHFLGIHERDRDRAESDDAYDPLFEETWDDQGWFESELIDDEAPPVPIDDQGFEKDEDLWEAGSKKLKERIQASLVIFTGGQQASVFEIKRSVTEIGRDRSSDVVLSDPYTSRKHLRIRRYSDHFELFDLTSDNGTLVNGYPISRIRLQDGDQIEIGRTVIKFISHTATKDDLVLTPPPQRVPWHLAPPPEIRVWWKSPLAIILGFTLVLSLFVVLTLLILLYA